MRTARAQGLLGGLGLTVGEQREAQPALGRRVVRIVRDQAAGQVDGLVVAQLDRGFGRDAQQRRVVAVGEARGRHLERPLEVARPERALLPP